MTIGCQGLAGNGARCPMDYCQSYLLNPDKWAPHLSHKKIRDDELKERVSEQTLSAKVMKSQNKNCVNVKISILIQPNYATLFRALRTAVGDGMRKKDTEIPPEHAFV
jgi:hypothetical protein